MSVSRRALLAAGGATFAGRAVAQPAFPSRPLIIVVPYTAGSSSDVLARVLAPPLGEQLGQTVVVENRPGAGGTIGVGYVTRSAPDGHTMVLTSGSAGPINRALYRNLSFDPVLDLSLVGQTNSGVVMLVVSAASPIRSVGDLMTMATAPGAAPVRYFSPGNGTYHHLCAALLAQAAPDRMEHIPYRGPPEGVTALLAGEVTFGFASPPSVVGLIQEGRIRAIGLAGSADPSPRFPDVPTLASSGFPRFAEMPVWVGLAVPRAVPQPVKQRLHDAIRATVALPAVQARFAQIGFDRAPVRTLADTEAFVEQQIAVWEPIVRTSGARID